MLVGWTVLWSLAGAAPLPVVAVVQRAAPVKPLEAAVEDGLRAALVATGTHRVLPTPDTQLGMETARAGKWKCDGAPACMSQLSNVLGAPVLVDVECTLTNERGTVVIARLLEGKQEKRRARTWLPTAPAAQQQGLRRLARALTQDSARLTVDTAPGTRVCVDGECLVSEETAVPWEGLAPGEHAVVVGPVGTDKTKTVALTAGQDARVDVNKLAPGEGDAGGQRSSRAPWALVAAGGVLAGAGGLGALGMAVLGVVAWGLAYAASTSLTQGSSGKLVATGNQTRTEVEATRNRVVAGGALGTLGLGVALLLGVVGLVGLACLGGGLAWGLLAN